MACVNAKRLKSLIDALRKQLGREPLIADITKVLGR